MSEVSSLLRDHPEINVNWTNPDCDLFTALHIASYHGQVEVVKLLLAHPNINVNLKNIYGETPFSIGCQYGRVSVVELLLKNPHVDITLDDKWGRTPLWWASYYGYHKVIEWLIASGRDLGDFENKKGKWKGEDLTALEIARNCSRLKLCLCLRDSLPTQYRPVMNFGRGLECWMRWQLRSLP